MFSAADWRFAAEQFVKKVPDKVIVHRECSQYLRWFLQWFLIFILSMTVLLLSIFEHVNEY